MLCAGLESMTQVFSVISSCIVDESVGRCSSHSLTPNSLACRNTRLLPMQAPAGVQLIAGHAGGLPSSCLDVSALERLLAEPNMLCFATVLMAQ